MNLDGKSVVVTGGTRGLGLGLVEALVPQGARVTVVARGADALAAVRDRLGVAVLKADVTDESTARELLKQTRPDLLVLNAGSKPRMGGIDALSESRFPGRLGGMGRFLFRKFFLESDYAEMMRGVLASIKVAAESD